ncbi:hypothetical protein Q1695_010837 [Nippostrongylus brasiliensis]|nr:hypothetical protein Q1695_010837 [Nippostrongylus brasiliensis]
MNGERMGTKKVKTCETHNIGRFSYSHGNGSVFHWPVVRAWSTGQRIQRINGQSQPVTVNVPNLWLNVVTLLSWSVN